MKRDPHLCINASPLGQGSRADALCGKELWDVKAVPLDTADIPVGSKLKVPEWVCQRCARKIGELPKAEERQWVYAISERVYGKAERESGAIG